MITRNSILAVPAFLALSAFASIQPAAAAKTSDVIAVCRHEGKACSGSWVEGSYTGCSPHARFVCDKKLA